MSEAAAVDPMIGRVIGDAYVIQQLVGVGGMGRVYRAEQRALGRVVAVKVVHRHLLGDRDSIARFYTEARAASSLNHPNSVSVFDFGRTSDGVLYLVMEFLRGRDLSRIMHEEGPLPFPRVISLALGTLGALGEAHARGVVHRDLKPENIIVERLRSGSDLVKVVDFGLAQMRGIEPVEAARGLVAGTPDYMAPEQARGHAVDGRSDLYSFGVVLYELLTGRLPFVDDTPAKVMTRHVVEDPPNPALVAPARQIPEELTNIVLRALRKDAAERYQEAEEMMVALRHVDESLKSVSARTCPRCGARNEGSKSYCGDCGQRLSVAPVAGTRSVLPQPTRERLMRQKELERLHTAYREQGTGPRALYVTGEIGSGKQRLLDELERRIEAEGGLCVRVGPHPTGALVAYGPVRQAVARLMGVEEPKLSQLVEDESAFRPGFAQAGLRELIVPEGLPGYEGVGRIAAVASALARALELATTRARGGRVALLIDNAGRCDALSRQVLARLPELVRSLRLLVVVSGVDAGPMTLDWQGEVVHLSPFNRLELAELVKAEVVPAVPPELACPLYVEQLRALRWEPTMEEPTPPSLAECVLRRLTTLDVSARRFLQAVAALGSRAPARLVERFVSTADVAAAPLLVEQGFLVTITGGYAFAHHYLREFVAASTPAETRKALHSRALELASQQGEPLEVRAEHAFRAGDTLTALMLLERSGQEALKRGDSLAAKVVFRQGLELARRELLETGEESLDAAIVSFSRQLGEALMWAGDATGAAGVINEAFQYASPHSLERARMTLLLGRVAERRDRPRDAARQFGHAIELARELSSAVLEARTLWALSRVRRSEADPKGALSSLTQALELLTRAEPRSARRTQLELEVAELLLEQGDLVSARDHVQRALDLASDGEWDALAALAIGIEGSIEELAGHRALAVDCYQRATQLAAKVGDERGYTRFRAAASAMNSKPPQAP